jgi:predicted ABC-type ATPase
MLECTEFVNSDEFAKSFSPFNPAEASVVAGRYMLMRIEYLLERKEDFSIETTLATRSLVGIINTAKELGYTINLLYFWLSSPELAIQRVRDRVKAGGHNIPENVIRRRYIMGLQYFFETYIPLSDRWVLADNSVSLFKVVAEGSSMGTFIKDEEKYKTIRSIVYPNEEE